MPGFFLHGLKQEVDWRIGQDVRLRACHLAPASGVCLRRRLLMKAAIGFSSVSWAAAPSAVPAITAAAKATGPGRASIDAALATTEIAIVCHR